MLKKLKANWLNILLALIGLLSSADAAAGLHAGKSPVDVSVLFSALMAAGTGGTLGVKWLNNRQVVARNVRQGLSPEFIERLENLYCVARDPDVTPEHAEQLAKIAGDLLRAENHRSKLESGIIYSNPVSLDPKVAEQIRKTIQENQGIFNSKPIVQP